MPTLPAPEIHTGVQALRNRREQAVIDATAATSAALLKSSRAAEVTNPTKEHP